MSDFAREGLSQHEYLDELSLGKLGRILWYTISERNFDRDDVLKALEDAGIDKKINLGDRNDFLRAIKLLVEEDLLRKVYENSDEICYQLTSERKMDNGEVGLEYEKKAIVQFFKADGSYDASDTDVLDLLRDYMSKEKDVFHAQDIRNLVRRLIVEQGYSIKPRAGVYFVPETRSEYVEQAFNFMSAIGIPQEAIGQFPIADLGDAKKQMAHIFEVQAKNKIRAYEEELNALYEKGARSTVLARRLTKLSELDAMAELYTDALEAKTTNMRKKIELLREELEEKVTEAEAEEAKNKKPRGTQRTLRKQRKTDDDLPEWANIFAPKLEQQTQPQKKEQTQQQKEKQTEQQNDIIEKSKDKEVEQQTPKQTRPQTEPQKKEQAEQQPEQQTSGIEIGIEPIVIENDDQFEVPDWMQD